MHIVLLEVGKAVHNAEELAYVVGADRCLEVEELLTGGDVYALVFHHAGVAAAGGVDGQGVEHGRVVGAGTDGGDAVFVGGQHTGLAGRGRSVGGMAFADGHGSVVGQALRGLGLMEGVV